ncbi:MAG: M16 family metallopeptidase [Phycisphaerae bacterium]
MAAEEFFIKEMPNGMTLLGQRMPQVTSAAMTLLAPAGSSHDEAQAAGSASVIAEWVLRGAGDRDTRMLNDELDSLGCQHSEHVNSEHMQFAAAQLGRNLPQVLAIYADIVRRPRLEDATFEPCRQLALQDLAALEDEPAQKCNLMLRERFYPYPLGRSPYGTAETLAALTPEVVRRQAQVHFNPHGAILAVAGAFDWARLCEDVDKYFGAWTQPADKPVTASPPARGALHVRKESAQVHIAMAHETAVAGDKRYYAARVAETVLSGGMSGRLFTEVREKRGLVYNVGSRYHSLKGAAGMFTYAGTTPEKAQQTLDVTIGELRRLGKGVTADELSRARTQLKSALVLQGESTSARANALAGDWYHLRRLRSLAEISAAIDRTTVDDVLACVAQYPARRLTVLTIGPEPLNLDAIGD